MESVRRIAIMLLVAMMLVLSASKGEAQLQPYRIIEVGSVPEVDKEWITRVVSETYVALERAGFVSASVITATAQPTLWLFTEPNTEAFFQELLRAGVVQLPIEEIRKHFGRTELLTSSLTLTLYIKVGSQSVRVGTRYAISKEASRLFGIYLLSGRDGIHVPTWLREGFTEVYAARVIDANGSTPYADNRRGAIQNAQRFIAAGGPNALSALETAAQWASAQQTANLRAYGIAFLAYELLERQVGTEKMAQYFTLFRQTSERENFFRVFGVTPESFYADFASYLKGVLP